VLGSGFVRSFDCRLCVLSIADCGLLVWVVADCGFQRTEGQKFGRASSSKRYTVLFLHLLSFFVVVVVVKFVLIGCQVARLLICLKKKIAEVPLGFTPFSEQLPMAVKAYFLGFGSQVP
jgi:hypothetical protein